MRYLKSYKLYENRYTIQSGINHLKRKYIKMGCDVELAPRYYDSVYLTLIKVPEELKGKGIATQFMKDLIEWADKSGLIITLSPTNTMGSDIERLKKFYERFGFVKNRKNGLTEKYAGAMIRFPETNKIV